MSNSSLASTIVNLEYLVEERLAALAVKGPDPKVMLDLARDFRRLACGALLMELDVDEFQDHLYRSGEVYLELLRLQKTRGLDPYYVTSSFAEPLVDAIAAGAFELAAAIAAEMPQRCLVEQGEIAEDHHYFRLLAALASGARPGAATAPTLEAFERSLQGGVSPRFDVMRALCAGAVEPFGDALAALQDAWHGELEQRRASERLDRYEKDTTRHVFLEGMAVLRLARRLGVEAGRRFRFVPAAALAAERKAFPVDFRLELPAAPRPPA